MVSRQSLEIHTILISVLTFLAYAPSLSVSLSLFLSLSVCLSHSLSLYVSISVCLSLSVCLTLCLSLAVCLKESSKFIFVRWFGASVELTNRTYSSHAAEIAVLFMVHKMYYREQMFVYCAKIFFALAP